MPSSLVAQDDHRNGRHAPSAAGVAGRLGDDATVMLVASPGGHLDELRHLLEPIGLGRCRYHWVTSRTTQTEALLASETVTWVEPVKSNEIGKSVRAVPSAISLHRSVRPDLVVSTGAALAAPHLLASSALRTPLWFIESATRTDGPSRVGSMVQRLPGARLLAQGDGWSDHRWGTVPSVFDAFRAASSLGEVEPRTAAVSLGSEKFPFSRAVDGVRRAVAGSDVSVSWQVGSTEVAGLRQWVDPAELRRSFAESDVVITHAGVGSLLAVLGRGKVPIVLSRRKGHGEHVDDHQVQIAEQLAARGLVMHVGPEQLTYRHLAEAASRRVEFATLPRSA